MIIIAHRSRVVSSPLTNVYQVQYKTWRFGKWKVDTNFEYYPDGAMPRGNLLFSKSQSYAKACVRADVLVTNSVVSYGQN